MVAETGCDAVMIGRAAPANPWIFRQIAQYTAFGIYDRPTDGSLPHDPHLLRDADGRDQEPGDQRQDEAVRLLVHARRSRRSIAQDHL